MKAKKKSANHAVTVRATLRLPQELWRAAQHQAIDQQIAAAELVTAR